MILYSAEKYCPLHRWFATDPIIDQKYTSCSWSLLQFEWNRMQNSRGWWHWQQKPKGTISSPQARWANHLRPLTPRHNATGNWCNATGVLQPVLQYLGFWLTLYCIKSDHALFLRSIALFYTELHCFALNCTGGRTKLMHLLMRLGQPLGWCSSSGTWAALRQVQSNYRRVTGNQCSWEVSEPVGSMLTSSLALRWPHLCWKAAIGFATDLSELCLVMWLV